MCVNKQIEANFIMEMHTWKAKAMCTLYLLRRSYLRRLSQIKGRPKYSKYHILYHILYLHNCSFILKFTQVLILSCLLLKCVQIIITKKTNALNSDKFRTKFAQDLIQVVPGYCGFWVPGKPLQQFHNNLFLIKRVF